MSQMASMPFPAFPFQAYPSQLDFMRACYSSAEAGAVALLQSPTGTGKTLSVSGLCLSLCP